MKDIKGPTPLSELGEFGLINHLTKSFKKKNKTTIYGIGDDAAVIGKGKEKTIITTDLLIEGIHFNLIYTPLKHLGYKSVIVNLSDIYAMNATPEQITVSIAVSSKFSVEALDELYKGIKLACDEYSVDLIGGDTTSSLTGLAICITAIGKAEKDKIVYRSGARKNDVICVTGDLGGAYMGLQLLEREKEVFKVNPNMQPKLDGYDYILQRQLKPEARKDIIELFGNLELIPTSMIDVSDGLSSELLHICDKSGCGCHIFEEKIPIHINTVKMADEFKIDPTTCALNGGEDYELLFTVPLDKIEIISNYASVTAIGYITDKESGKYLIARDGTKIELIAQGWNALKKNKN
ncbi:MAG: thiamine-phosphate kinase [Marinilabiliales bacterium]